MLFDHTLSLISLRTVTVTVTVTLASYGNPKILIVLSCDTLCWMSSFQWLTTNEWWILKNTTSTLLNVYRVSPFKVNTIAFIKQWYIRLWLVWLIVSRAINRPVVPILSPFLSLKVTLFSPLRLSSIDIDWRAQDNPLCGWGYSTIFTTVGYRDKTKGKWGNKRKWCISKRQHDLRKNDVL